MRTPIGMTIHLATLSSREWNANSTIGFQDVCLMILRPSIRPSTAMQNYMANESLDITYECRPIKAATEVLGRLGLDEGTE